MNYIELRSSIQDYLENRETSFVNMIPNIVQRAEQRIYNDAQLPVLKAQTTISTVANTNTVTVPNDLITVYSFKVQSGTMFSDMFMRDADYIRAMYPSTADVGVPESYGIVNHNTYILGPTPAAVYTLHLDYMRYPTSIVTASTTWLGDKYEAVLLAACLLEGAVYSKLDPNDIANYDQAYAASLQGLANVGIKVSRQNKFMMTKSSGPERSQ